MKIFKLTLVTTLVVFVALFASCKDKGGKEPIKQSEGSSFMALALRMPQNNFRENKGEYPGKEKINTIDVYVIDQTTGKVAQKTFNGDEYNELAGSLVTPKDAAVFKTTPGAKRVYVLVNADPAIKQEVENAIGEKMLENVKTKAVALTENLDKIAIKHASDTETTILFSSDLDDTQNTQEFNIEDGVTKEQVLGTAKKNYVKVNLKRVVSVAYLTKDAGIEDIKAAVVVNGVKQAEQTVLKVTTWNWAVGQVEKNFFVSPVTDATAEIVKSPAFDYQPTNAEYYDLNGTNNGFTHFFYSDLLNRTRTIDDVMATRDAGGIGAAAMAAPVFVTENTHAKSPENFKRGNTTYMLVRTIMVPQVWSDGQKHTAPKTAPGLDYSPVQIDRPDPIPATATKEEVAAYEKALFAAFAEATFENDGSFYIGDVDHGIYADYETMYKAKGGQDGTLYRGGKVIYYVYLNPEDAPAGTTSPATGKNVFYNTLRNGIYHANITGIKKIGFNYNASHPDPNPAVEEEDPGKKNPDIDPDPDKPSPVPHPEDPIDPVETYMGVEINLIPWTVYSYDIEL